MNQIWKRLIFAAVILSLMAGSAFWVSRKQEHSFSEIIHITASEYPEQTYYADLLVQLPEKDPQSHPPQAYAWHPGSQP